MTAQNAFVSVTGHAAHATMNIQALTRQYWPTAALFVALIAIWQLAVSTTGILDASMAERAALMRSTAKAKS